MQDIQSGEYPIKLLRVLKRSKSVYVSHVPYVATSIFAMVSISHVRCKLVFIEKSNIIII